MKLLKLAPTMSPNKHQAVPKLMLFFVLDRRDNATAMAIALRRADTLFQIVENLHGGAKILAGGQSLIPLVNRGDVAPTALIDINRVEGLETIDLVGESLEIGALTRLESVRIAPLVIAHAPLLSAALSWVANPAVRERGTLVGNAVACPPGAEAVAALHLQNARFVTVDVAGNRSEQSLAPLPEGTFVVAIRIPIVSPGTHAGFYEVQRRFGHLGLVGAGIMQRAEGTLSMVLSGVLERPLLAPALAEAVMAGTHDDEGLLAAFDEDLAGQIPRADIHATSRYRRDVVPAIVRRALGRLHNGITGPALQSRSTGKSTSLPVIPQEAPASFLRPRPAPLGTLEADVNTVSLHVDGCERTLTIAGTTTLADILDLRVGCGEGVCGACTVAVDGRPVRACLMLAGQADGTWVETVASLHLIEGSARDTDGLTPLQRALRERQAFQCGWCVPGMLVGTACFLRDQNQIAPEDVAMHLVGHMCRCLASVGVADAIEDVFEDRRRQCE